MWQCFSCGRKVHDGVARCPQCKEEYVDSVYKDEEKGLTIRVVLSDPTNTFNVGNFFSTRIQKQDFRMGIAMSVALIVLLLSLPVLLYTVKKTYDDDGRFFILSAFAAYSLVSLLRVLLLLLLNKYLKNFEFANSSRSAINYLIVSLIFLIGVFFHHAYFTNGSIVFLSVPFVIYLLSQFMLGWRLIQIANHDYIGGLSPLGYMVCISAIFPPLWVLNFVFMSMLFIKAKRFSDTYGFEKENKSFNACC